jgi:hypothetical protein
MSHIKKEVEIQTRGKKFEVCFDLSAGIIRIKPEILDEMSSCSFKLRFDPGEKFCHIKRLGQVIVRPDF